MSTVSVVIPTYERGAFVRAAVRSVLAQSVGAEVIVVRSNGDSGAEGLSSEFAGITVIDNDGERAAARNVGCSIAAGEWVLFLDDDDLLLPNALGSLLGAMNSPQPDAVRGARVEFDAADTIPQNSTQKAPIVRQLQRDDLIIGAEVLTPSQTLFRRAALPAVPFREEFVPVEDYALGVAMALRGANVLATSATTTAYRRHAGQTVGSVLNVRSLERRRAVMAETTIALADDRRLRHRARGYHELFAALPVELSTGHRTRAIGAVLSAAAWSPSLLRTSMWWRAGALAALRGLRS